jgi:hypothetical protein
MLEEHHEWMPMNARERFAATMHYQPRDRCPIMDFGFWEGLLENWEAEGYPPGADPDEFFGMDPQWITLPIATGLHPVFEPEVLEDRGETIVLRDEEGVLQEKTKFLGSIPRFMEHTLKDRASWEEHFKWRLDGSMPSRYGEDWERRRAEYLDPARDYPLGIPAGSLYGWIRNWMGLEAVSCLMYEDRPLFEEMVETVTDCIIAAITPALEAGVRPEYASMWEDMCCRSGPLMAPDMFAEILVPQYKRITSLLKRYGVDVVILDCDGLITALAPHWLEGGVNTMFPIEVGVWKADPVQFRKEYGKEMLLIGGVDKGILAGTKEGIAAEVERLTPLVEEGGYIPTCDHRVPPWVSLDNYIFFLEEMKRVWGKGLPNIRPTGTPLPVTSAPPQSG